MDPVTIFSLVTLCISSSASLYKAVDAIKSRKQDVRHLKKEVGDLNIVLQALAKNLEETTENFEILRLILEQCGRACKDFEEKVLDKLGKTESPLKDVKAFARLQLLGGSVNSFRKLIGSYKATLTIALADANLRTVQVTRQLLEKYTEMTQNTTLDLEEQITELSDRLNLLQSEDFLAFSETSSGQRDSEPIVAKQTLEQKASLEQCLTVCHQLLNHIHAAERSLPRDAAGVVGTVGGQYTVAGVDSLASRLTTDALQMCTHNINAAKQHLEDIRKEGKLPDETDQDQMMQQLDTARQCLEIVGKAQEHRVNVFENIATAEDVFQTVVSTIGDLIRANGLTIGARSVNIMGQMNDDSLQKIAGDLRTNMVQRSTPEHADTKFEARHGFGHTITPKKL